MGTLTLPFEEGCRLRDIGISQAVDHADKVINRWSEDAYLLLREYVQTHDGEFLAEDARAYAETMGLCKAPSDRAWGGVIRKAACKGLIIRTGYGQVKNPNAHCANAARWRRKERV